MNGPGETDLQTMLDSLDVVRRPGTYTFVSLEVPTPELLASAHAMVTEGDTTTLVLPVESARRVGLDVVVDMAWLSLTVHS
ncbi:MAG: ACT domain-containing protein, partial [Ilumatobacter sp.]